MRVIGLRWVGTATSNYDEMVTFLRDVLGLRTDFEKLSTTEFRTANGDAVQVMGPDDLYHAFFDEHARGPVVLFEVDDVRMAAAELRDAGIEVVGDLQTDSNWEWVHFRAPDGHMYELASRRVP